MPYENILKNIKKTSSKSRNPFAAPAKSRKAGPMRSRKSKRNKNTKSQISEIEKEYSP